MNGDFTAKFIWACAFLFVYSLAGEILLFKIAKMNLTNSRRKKLPQLLDQSNRNYISIFALAANTSQSDQIEMAAYNMSNIQVSPDITSTLLLLQQGNLYKLPQKLMHDISRSSRPEVICKKAALKTTQNSQGNNCVGVSF